MSTTINMPAAAKQDSHFVTVGGLNTVYENVRQICENLDKRIDTIGKLYTLKGDINEPTPQGTWTKFLEVGKGPIDGENTNIEQGDAWVVHSGYKEYSKDKDQFPEWKDGGDPRIFICIQGYTNKILVNDSGNANFWENYWMPIDLHLNKASNKSYGVITQTGSYKATSSTYGFVKTKSNVASSHQYGLNLASNGQAYVDIAAPTDSNYGVIKIGFTDDPSSGKYAVELDSDKAFVQVDLASKTARGGVKIDPTDTENAEVPASRKYSLRTASNENAYTEIPVAGSTSYGVIRIDDSIEDVTSGKYSVELDSDDKAFVDIPVPNGTDYGVIKTGYTTADYDDNDSHGRKTAVELDSDDKAFVDIPVAGSNYGLIRTGHTGGDHDNSTDGYGSKYGLKLEKNPASGNTSKDNRAYVDIPTSTSTKYGLIRIGHGGGDYDTSDPDAHGSKYGLKLESFKDSEESSAVANRAYIDIPAATGSNYGLIKTGSNSASNHTYGVVLNTSKQAYVDVNVSSSSDYGVAKVGYTSGANGTKVNIDNGNLYVPVWDITAGNNITIDAVNNAKKNIRAKIYTSSAGNGIDITTGTFTNDISTQTIKNTGLISGKDTPDSGTSTDGYVYFNKGKTDGTNEQVAVKVQGWGNKQETSTAVYTTETTTRTVGGENTTPVWINNGVPNAIKKISLAQQGNVASFEDTNDSASAVVITGKSVDSSTSTSSGAAALKVDGGIVAYHGIAANAVYHAVWNDVSDAVEVQDTCDIKPGCCYYFDGSEYHKTDKYCQKGIIGIHSDTAGSVLGKKGKHKELDISIGGFVLAYVDKQYKVGTPLTSTKNGQLTKMRILDRIFHPERLVATYWKSEPEMYWGDDTRKVKVDGRKWVKVR